MSLDQLVEVEISTSTSLFPIRPTEAPGSVYTFGRADFERLGVRRLDQLFRLIPGFQLNQYRKRDHSLWARGIIDRNNNKMIMVIDGVPVRRIYYGQFSLGDTLPLERIERVEVILGPASSLYGADAFGGVISITTRSQTPLPVQEATLEIADNARTKGTLWTGTQQTRLFASLLTQDAPFSSHRTAFDGNPAKQPLDEEVVNLSVHHQFSDSLSINLDLRRGDSPFLFIPSTQDGVVRDRAFTASLAYHTGDVEQGRNELSLYYLRDRSSEIEIEQQSRADGYLEHQQADLLGINLRHARRVGEHTLLVGVEGKQEKAKNLAYTRWFHYREGFLDPPEQGYLVSNPHFSSENYALYAQDIWSIGTDLALTLGARYDRYDAFGEHSNFRGALVYTPTEKTSWKLLYGTAIRTPTYREHMKILEGTAFIAPIPAPEEISSLEAALHHRIGAADLSVTLFRNTLKAFIRETPTPDELDQYFANSRNPWRIRGAEFLCQYSPVSRLSFRAGLSWLDAQWDLPGNPPYLSRVSSSLVVNYALSVRHRIGFTLTSSGKRSETNSFSGDTPNAFVRVALHAEGHLAPGLRYEFGADNLFDRKIYDPAGDFGWMHNTEQSRREIWARLIWGFGG